jgi:hypothetical protein
MVLGCTAFSTRRRRSAQLAAVQRYNRIVTGCSNRGAHLYGWTSGTLRLGQGRTVTASLGAFAPLPLWHWNCTARASGRRRSALPASN